MSRLMNQTYFECYEFDVNVVLVVIATNTINTILVVSTNELEYTVKFQYF